MFPDIVKFEESGVTKPQDRAMKKGFVSNKLVREMREQGYVPVLDMYPQMHSEYWEEKELFRYTVAVYGVKVDEPWTYEGWLDGRFLTATMKTKFGQFYEVWESV